MIDSTLTAAVIAAVPSTIVGIVGWLLRRLIADLSRTIDQLGSDMRQMRDSLGLVHTDTATLRVRVEVLERDRAHAQAGLDELRRDLADMRRSA